VILNGFATYKTAMFLFYYIKNYRFLIIKSISAAN